MMPFAAVLLAGGQSRRMGRDKALLPLKDGRLLWERQWGILRALEPAELFVSGFRRAEFPPEISCLPDEVPGRGPLGGIFTTLHTMKSPRLVVLAVDLPEMTMEFLRALLAFSEQGGRGIVPRYRNHGLYEPLAAVYPQACQDLAAAKSQEDDWSMQSFVRAAGLLLQSREILADEESLFTNWNAPGDANHLGLSEKESIAG